MTSSSSRSESDFLGARSIPAAAYWGVQALLVPEKMTRPIRLEE